MWNRYALELAYELVRELISSRIGGISHQINIEEQKDFPSKARIAALEAEAVALARERENLDPADNEKILSLIERYRRPSTSDEYLLSFTSSIAASPRQSTRGARLVLAKANAVFGDPSKSERWLRSSSVFVRGVPVELLGSKDGRRSVYDELVRIDVGDFA